MAGVIGEVDITIGADARPFEGGLNRAMSGLASKMTAKVAAPMKRMFNALPEGAKSAITRIGQSFSSGFTAIQNRFPRLSSAAGTAFSKMGSLASKAGGAVKRTLSESFTAVGNIAGTAFAVVGGVIAANLDKGVERADILNNFPKVMENIGFSASDAEAAINKIADSLDGLPSTTQSIAMVTQSLTPLTGNIGKAADIALSLNNAVLAGGASFTLQENAIEQYRQMLARGEVDMMSWRSLMTAMPGQLDQLAVALLGAGNNSMDLYDAMQAGTVSLDDFNDAMVQLNQEGIDGLSSFEDQARAATGGIGTAMKNLGNRVATSIAKILQYFGVDGIAGAINAFTSKFSGWADSLVGFIDRVRSKFSGMSGVADGLWPIAGAVVGILSEFKKFIPIVGRILPGISGPVGAVIGLFVQMWQNSEKLREAVGNAFQRIGSVIGNVLGGSGGVLEKFTTAIGKVAQVLGDVLAAAINMVVPLLEWLIDPVISLLVDAISWLIDIAASAAQALVDFFTGAGDSAGGFADFFVGLWDGIKSVVGAVVDWITGTVVPAFTAAWEWLVDVTEPLREVMISVWEGIRDAVGAVVEWFTGTLVPMLSGVWEAITEAVSAFVEWLSPYWTAFWEGVWERVELVWSLIEPFITAAIENLKTVISTGIEIVATVWGTVWEHIKIVVTAVWDVIKTYVETAINVVKGIIQLVTSVIKGDWKGAWEAIKSIGEAVWNGIKSVVTTVFNAVKAVITNILNGIKSLWSSVWNGIKSVASNVWNAIKSFVSNAINNVQSVISNRLSSIRNLWSNIWNGIRTAFSNIWNGIKNAASNGINNVYNTVTRIKDRILGFFSGAGSWLLNAGKNIISGLTSGIKDAIGGAVDAVKGGLSRIRNLLPFSPAKEGPFSGRGWTEYSGEALMDGFSEGIRDRNREVESALTGTLREARNVFTELGDLKVPAGHVEASNFSGVGVMRAVQSRTSQLEAARVLDRGETAAGIVYNDNRTVNNPVAEPDSIRIEENLQKAAANVGGLG